MSVGADSSHFFSFLFCKMVFLSPRLRDCRHFSVVSSHFTSADCWARVLVIGIGIGESKRLRRGRVSVCVLYAKQNYTEKKEMNTTRRTTPNALLGKNTRPNLAAKQQQMISAAKTIVVLNR